MKTIRAMLAFSILAVCVACGGGPSNNQHNGNGNSPLDPQGNWLFTFTGSDNVVQLEFAGQLFELNPPVVTSNSMGSSQLGFPCGGITVNGQASGTNTINLTAVEVDYSGQPSYSMTGTIAADQAHMSGTWVANGSNCTANIAGTWTAEALAPVSRTWTGTDSNGDSITAVLTEDTSQTDTTMGQVTGTVTISGSCFAGPLTLIGYGTSAHFGEQMLLGTQPDINGASLSATGTVDPTAALYSDVTWTVTGGSCNGAMYTGNLQ